MASRLRRELGESEEQFDVLGDHQFKRGIITSVQSLVTTKPRDCRRRCEMRAIFVW